jgi:hypothetical protein
LQAGNVVRLQAKEELAGHGLGNTIASLANLHANHDLLYRCKAKMRHRVEMFFIASNLH